MTDLAFVTELGGHSIVQVHGGWIATHKVNGVKSYYNTFGRAILL